MVFKKNIEPVYKVEQGSGLSSLTVTTIAQTILQLIRSAELCQLETVGFQASMN